MEFTSESQQLVETVLHGNYCIGCGACATVQGSPFKIKMDDYGNYVAYVDPQMDASEAGVKVLDICPFSGVSKNEDEIGAIVYPENIKNNDLGNYLKCFAGFVSEGDYRAKGSSGGFGKWLGATLLKENEVDFFVQVASNKTLSSNVPLFDYQVFDSAEEVINGSKSCYYPVTLEKVIKRIQEVDGRYAVTGVPCFIKTLRLLALQNEVLAARIRFTIANVCGGMKSANQAKMIGWQLGVHPDHLMAIDFRRKYTDRPASNKIYQVWSNLDQVERFQHDMKLVGTGWEGYFKPKACEYCDDVVGETADISLGDAWLPQYEKDPRGTSVMVVRNAILLRLLEKHHALHALHLEEISDETAVRSQAGGFRHKREALSFRVSRKEASKEWFPKKRIHSKQFVINNKRKLIYSQREKISQESHQIFLEALQKNDLNHFLQGVKPLDMEYRRLNKRSLIRKALSFLKRKIWK